MRRRANGPNVTVDSPATPNSAVSVTVYSREDCHLCEEAISTVRAVAAETETPIDLRTVDVDDDPELREEYGKRVPYVLIDGRPKFKYRVDDDELEALFAERQRGTTGGDE